MTKDRNGDKIVKGDFILTTKAMSIKTYDGTICVGYVDRIDGENVWLKNVV